jgi:signal transduction histidine kinase
MEAGILDHHMGLGPRAFVQFDETVSSLVKTAIEAERARMADEIHDGLAQAFIAVMMHARVARRDGGRRRVLRCLEEIESAAALGLEEARRSVFGMRAVFVERGGLVRALERLAGSLSTTGGTRFVLVHPSRALELPPAVEDAAYRIVQEATQNALKHANARLVTIHLESQGGQLQLRIEDDGHGVGQDVIQCARERGGLRGMRERAERFGGNLVVEPRAPRGTRVNVLLPLKKAA